MTLSLKQYGDNLAELAQIIHQRNSDAGWWLDLQTRESILETRNRPELLALVTSEVSEADEGHTGDLMDDKLAHLPMYSVELADVAIRLLDMIGAEDRLYGNSIGFYYEGAVEAWRHALNGCSHERRLLTIINTVSRALEHRRKSRTDQYREELSEALAVTFAVAHLTGVDILDVIDQKVAYNATREDHRLEVRAADGGKKI
jgi:NTP pyrophosphatase (non-canonical NTP hydrolase)